MVVNHEAPSSLADAFEEAKHLWGGFHCATPPHKRRNNAFAPTSASRAHLFASPCRNTSSQQRRLNWRTKRAGISVGRSFSTPPCWGVRHHAAADVS
ncbi:hypothetical protein MRX96_033670 [Rhipicephalus microplus]